MSPRRPVWQQALVTATLVAMASFVGFGAGSSRGEFGTSIGTWTMFLAAPLTLVLAALRWRRGSKRRWVFPLVGVVVYSALGWVGGGFSFDRWPPAIPLLMAKPLLYPVAGLVWGMLLRQLWEQGYLAFMGFERDSE